ncbi:hypothetical protein V1515DRAFT_600094 [Lipomyces mesembrius]
MSSWLIHLSTRFLGYCCFLCSSATVGNQFKELNRLGEPCLQIGRRGIAQYSPFMYMNYTVSLGLDGHQIPDFEPTNKMPKSGGPTLNGQGDKAQRTATRICIDSRALICYSAMNYI